MIVLGWMQSWVKFFQPRQRPFDTSREYQVLEPSQDADRRALNTWRARCIRAEDALLVVMGELGVPGEDTPAPVANAYLAAKNHLVCPSVKSPSRPSTSPRRRGNMTWRIDKLKSENAELRELVKLAVHCLDSTPHLATLYDCEEWEKCGGCGWRRFRNDACALLEER